MTALKVKNGELLAATRFLGRINTEERSVRFAFKVSTIINRVNAVVKIIEDLRQKLVKEGSEKDKDGNEVFADEKKQYIKLTDEGGKKLEELMLIESDIDVEQFTLDELELAKVNVAPAEIPVIKWMIKE